MSTTDTLLFTRQLEVWLTFTMFSSTIKLILDMTLTKSYSSMLAVKISMELLCRRSSKEEFQQECWWSENHAYRKMPAILDTWRKENLPLLSKEPMTNSAGMLVLLSGNTLQTLLATPSKQWQAILLSDARRTRNATDPYHNQSIIIKYV